MKKILVSCLAIASLAAFKAIDELPIGADLPKAEVKMKDVSGKEVSLKTAMKKNGLLVMFSCNTCPVVVNNQSRTVEAGNYALGKEVGVVLINSNEAYRSGDDSFEAMKNYAKSQGYKWNYVVDENSVVADAFGAKRTPEVFLFNRQGKLVYHGAMDDSPNKAENVKRKHLQEAIDELTAGKEISVKTTRSVGCSIKRI